MRREARGGFRSPDLRDGALGTSVCVCQKPAELPMGDRKGIAMPNSVYKVIELVGTNPESWEKAAAAAIEMASRTLRDLRIAEVTQLDMQLQDGKVVAYRTKVKLSFKIHGEDDEELTEP